MKAVIILLLSLLSLFQITKPIVSVAKAETIEGIAGNIRISKGGLVYLLVASNIYEPLKPYLERWMNDALQDGYEPMLKVITKETSEQIREMLSKTPNINGCLMVGDIPVAYYEFPREKPHFSPFPFDLYYMDLNSVWIDVDHNGIFDKYSGDIYPEIWIGRLKPPVEDLEDQVKLLKIYFNKNHLYRIGGFTLPYRALIYADDDTYPEVAMRVGPLVDQALKPLYENRTVIMDPELTYALDYLKRLTEGWHLVHVNVHGSEKSQSFWMQGEWTPVSSKDIREINPKAFFYTLSSCNTGRYTETNYLAGWYIFTKYGLFAIAATSNSVTPTHYPNLYHHLSQSMCFGDAFLYWIQGYIAYLQKSSHSMLQAFSEIMIGDPSLKPIRTGPDSDGDYLSDQYEGNIGTDPNNPDSDEDGLMDYEEIVIYETSPTNSDSDYDDVKDGEDMHPLDPMPENALREISNAEKAIIRAEQEGRTQGLDDARHKLTAARNAYNYEQYNTSISLAKEALELAKKAETLTTSYSPRPPSPTMYMPKISIMAILLVALAIAVAFILVKKLQHRQRLD